LFNLILKHSIRVHSITNLFVILFSLFFILLSCALLFLDSQISAIFIFSVQIVSHEFFQHINLFLNLSFYFESGETRVENECMRADGFVFRFRFAKCVPEGLHMRAVQRTYCAATWTEGPFIYAALRHDHKVRNKFWEASIL